MPPDERDWKLGAFLEAHERAVTGLSPDMTIAEVLDAGFLDTWHDIFAFWRWIKTLIHHEPTPAPTPSPVPPSPDPPPAPTPTPAPPTPGADGTWADPENVLDQGNTPHCVGFAWAQWGNTLPVDDQFQNADGDMIYYAAKMIDGEPGKEDGSDTRSGAKAMKQRGRLGGYAFAATTQEISEWLEQHGPVVVGTDWYNAMFTPDADGYLNLEGGVAGGHEWLLVGHAPHGHGNVTEDSYVMQNSWGDSWGDHGRAWIRVADFAKLLQNGGDACAGVELPR